LPTCFIDVGDGSGSQFEMVGQENILLAGFLDPDKQCGATESDTFSKYYNITQDDAPPGSCAIAMVTNSDHQVAVRKTRSE